MFARYLRLQIQIHKLTQQIIFFFLTERSCTEVTCSFTIDNGVKSVEYVDQMGKSFYLTPSGDERNWQKEKMINFRSCNPFKPGQLKIKGKDFNVKRDKNFYCTWSGLLMHCKSVVSYNVFKFIITKFLIIHLVILSGQVTLQVPGIILFQIQRIGLMT